jgi:hypothetical protein
LGASSMLPILIPRRRVMDVIGVEVGSGVNVGGTGVSVG